MAFSQKNVNFLYMTGSDCHLLSWKVIIQSFINSKEGFLLKLNKKIKIKN